jgi:hypothetical protein
VCDLRVKDRGRLVPREEFAGKRGGNGQGGADEEIPFGFPEETAAVAGRAGDVAGLHAAGGGEGVHDAAGPVDEGPSFASGGPFAEVIQKRPGIVPQGSPDFDDSREVHSDRSFRYQAG